MQVAERLIKAGAKLETRDIRGLTPLHVAVLSDQIALVRALVRAGLLLFVTRQLSLLFTLVHICASTLSQRHARERTLHTHTRRIHAHCTHTHRTLARAHTHRTHAHTRIHAHIYNTHTHTHTHGGETQVAETQEEGCSAGRRRQDACMQRQAALSTGRRTADRAPFASREIKTHHGHNIVLIDAHSAAAHGAQSHRFDIQLHL